MPSQKQKAALRAKPPKKYSAFTLIEVLVALAVIASALAAAVKGVSQYVKQASYLQDKTIAGWVAANKITEWHVLDNWPSPGTRSGDMDMAGHEWFWQTTVAETQDANVRRMDVVVKANQSDKEWLTTVVSYVAKP